MNAVMAKPATGSPHLYPAATRARPVSAPREEIASSHECRASAISVSEPIRLPTRRLYQATAWFPAMPRTKPAADNRWCGSRETPRVLRRGMTSTRKAPPPTHSIDPFPWRLAQKPIPGLVQTGRGAYGPVYDRRDARSRAIISRAEYIRRHVECPSAPVTARVESAAAAGSTAFWTPCQAWALPRGTPIRSRAEGLITTPSSPRTDEPGDRISIGHRGCISETMVAELAGCEDGRMNGGGARGAPGGKQAAGGWARWQAA